MLWMYGSGTISMIQANEHATVAQGKLVLYLL